MRVTATFSEVEKYIAEKINRKIHLSCVNGDTVFVFKKLNLLFVEKKIGVRLKMVTFSNTAVVIEYSGGIGVRAIVEGGLKLLGYVQPDLANAVKSITGHQILLDMKSIPKLAEVLKNITLESLQFYEEGAAVDFSLKA